MITRTMIGLVMMHTMPQGGANFVAHTVTVLNKVWSHVVTIAKSLIGIGLIATKEGEDDGWHARC